MTIAKRLMILLALPLVALLGLGVFTRLQLAEVEERSRFVAESRIVALATLGNLARSSAELRVNVRSYLLTTNEVQRAAARAAFDKGERDVTAFLQQYADNLVVSDRGRRLLTQDPNAEPGLDYRSQAGHVARGCGQAPGSRRTPQ